MTTVLKAEFFDQMMKVFDGSQKPPIIGAGITAKVVSSPGGSFTFIASIVDKKGRELSEIARVEDFAPDMTVTLLDIHQCFNITLSRP